jgi:FtsX-like permease family
MSGSARRSVAFIASIQLRRRLLSLAVIAVVLGLVGGAAMSLIAGSRRSATVVDRYYRASLRYDMSVFAPTVTRSQIASIPGVTRVDGNSYLGIVSRGADGKTLTGVNGLALDPASLDRTIHLLRGRTLRPNETSNNVLVNEAFVREYHGDVGDDMPVQLFAEADRDKVSAGAYDPTGPHAVFHIVGVVRIPNDIAIPETRSVGLSSSASTNFMIVPISWYDENRSTFLDFGESFDVQLRSPADRARVQQEITSRARAADPNADPAQFGPPRFSALRPSFDTPVDLETTIILVLGSAVALAGAIAVALMLRAEQRAHTSEDPTLRALGATRIDLGLVAALRSLPVAVGGAALAVLVAYGLSSRYPIGVGGRLELDVGRQFNTAVLLLAAVVIIVGVVAIGFAFGVLHSARPPSPRHRRTLARWFVRGGAPVDAVVGAHFAFDRGGTGNAVPARTAIVGGAIALAAITGIGVFLSGVDDLYSQPAAHGFAWDVAVGNTNFPLLDTTTAALRRDPRLRAVQIAQQGPAELDGRQANMLAIEPGSAAPPRVLSGRLPAAPNEIALGGRMQHDLHAHLGSTVRFSLEGSAFAGDNPTDVDLTVVGTTLAPTIGDADLGEVSVVTFDAIKRAGGDPKPQLALAEYRSQNTARTTEALDRDYTEEMITDVVPPRAVSLHRLRVLPIAGLLLAGLLGTVLLVYVLAIAVRARTKEFGIVRALGMSARRLRRVLGWEAIVISTAMALIGIPVGLFLGALLWRVVASGLGISEAPTISPWTLASIPAVILVGLAATLVPGRRLRGDDVATLLHAE